MKPKPNIVFILTDDQGWKDLSCTGSLYYRTSHIDRLADDGVLFTQAYSAAPICSPSRGAIYGGQYPARTKLSAVVRPYVEPDAGLQQMSKPQKGNLQTREAPHRHCLPPNVPTIAELLRPAGYRTGFVGKWHCGWNEAHQPDKRGWDYAVGFRTVPTGTKGHFGKDFIEFKCKGLDDMRPDEYMTDVLTDRAEGFLREAAGSGEPFFLVLSHYAVHQPLDAPPELVEKYRKLPTTDHDNPIYAAMLEKVDDSIGRVVEILAELGIADNTMVVFTSDNGGLSPKSTSNYPLMGGKSFCYEAAMRVPLVVKWPAAVAPGRRESTRTISVDFMKTWLEMAGVTPPANLPLDGVSLLGLLIDGRRPLARPIFFHHPHYTHAAGPFSSVIDNDWKLIRFYNDTSGRDQVFDLAVDPFEQDDLSAARPARADKLRKILDDWLAETAAEMPLPNEQFNADQPPLKDKRFTWELALAERAEHERKLRASEVGRQ